MITSAFRLLISNLGWSDSVTNDFSADARREAEGSIWQLLQLSNVEWYEFIDRSSSSSTDIQNFGWKILESASTSSMASNAMVNQNMCKIKRSGRKFHQIVWEWNHTHLSEAWNMPCIVIYYCMQLGATFAMPVVFPIQLFWCYPTASLLGYLRKLKIFWLGEYLSTHQSGSKDHVRIAREVSGAIFVHKTFTVLSALNQSF